MDILNQPSDLLRKKTLGPLDDQICKVTDAGRLDSAVVDWTANVEITDAVKKLPASRLPEVVDLLRRRLKSSDPRSVYLSLVLLEQLLKGVELPLAQATGRDPKFMGTLTAVTKATVKAAKSGAKGSSAFRDAADKALELLQTAGEEWLPLRSAVNELGPWVDAYHALKADGVEFPLVWGDETRPRILEASTIARLQAQSDKASQHRASPGASAARLGSSHTATHRAAPGTGHSTGSRRGSLTTAGPDGDTESVLASLTARLEKAGVQMATNGGAGGTAAVTAKAAAAVAADDEAASLARTLRSKQPEVQGLAEACLAAGADPAQLEGLLDLNDRLATVLQVYETARDKGRAGQAAGGKGSSAAPATTPSTTVVSSSGGVAGLFGAAVASRSRSNTGHVGLGDDEDDNHPHHSQAHGHAQASDAHDDGTDILELGRGKRSSLGSNGHMGSGHAPSPSATSGLAMSIGKLGLGLSSSLGRSRAGTAGSTGSTAASTTVTKWSLSPAPGTAAGPGPASDVKGGSIGRPRGGTAGSVTSAGQATAASQSASRRPSKSGLLGSAHGQDQHGEGHQLDLLLDITGSQAHTGATGAGTTQAVGLADFDPFGTSAAVVGTTQMSTTAATAVDQAFDPFSAVGANQSNTTTDVAASKSAVAAQPKPAMQDVAVNLLGGGVPVPSKSAPRLLAPPRTGPTTDSLGPKTQAQGQSSSQTKATGGMADLADLFASPAPVQHATMPARPAAMTAWPQAQASAANMMQAQAKVAVDPFADLDFLHASSNAAHGTVGSNNPFA